MPVKKIKSKNFLNKIRSKPRAIYSRSVSFIRKRPVLSFLIVLGVLFLAIALGNLLAPKKTEQPKQTVVKEVTVYKIGTAPKVTLQAKVDKSGVIKIVAQSPGVVESINVLEGERVGKGANLLNLASNYSGGNAPRLQTAIAFKQNQIVLETFQTQKDLILKNRELANKSLENVTGLREITNNSLVVTRQIFDLNQDVVRAIDQNIRTLESNNVGGANDQTILQSRQLKSQFESANQGLRMQIATSEFSADPSGPQSQIAEIQQQVALKQLDIQEKTLNLSKEISSLQVALASVNAELMHPVAPFAGTVERINVHVGEVVNPGTTLLTLSGDVQATKIITLVPENLARNISRLEESEIKIDGRTFKILPSLISKDATDGQLYSVIYNLPETESKDLTVGNFVSLDVPVGMPSTGKTVPFIPLDSIFQGEDYSYVFVVVGEKVESRKVELGKVYGRFVEILSGLNALDQVILERNVLSGDKVSVRL